MEINDVPNTFGRMYSEKIDDTTETISLDICRDTDFFKGFKMFITYEMLVGKCRNDIITIANNIDRKNKTIPSVEEIMLYNKSRDPIKNLLIYKAQTSILEIYLEDIASSEFIDEIPLKDYIVFIRFLRNRIFNNNHIYGGYRKNNRTKFIGNKNYKKSYSLQSYIDIHIANTFKVICPELEDDLLFPKGLLLKEMIGINLLECSSILYKKEQVLRGTLENPKDAFKYICYPTENINRKGMEYIFNHTEVYKTKLNRRDEYGKEKKTLTPNKHEDTSVEINDDINKDILPIDKLKPLLSGYNNPIPILIFNRIRHDLYVLKNHNDNIIVDSSTNLYTYSDIMDLALRLKESIRIPIEKDINIDYDPMYIRKNESLYLSTNICNVVGWITDIKYTDILGTIVISGAHNMEAGKEIKLKPVKVVTHYLRERDDDTERITKIIKIPKVFLKH